MATRRAVCLLRSRRRTFLYVNFVMATVRKIEKNNCLCIHRQYYVQLVIKNIIYIFCSSLGRYINWTVSDNRPWAEDVASVEMHQCAFFMSTKFTLVGLLSLEDCRVGYVEFFIIKSQYEPEVTLETPTQFNVSDSRYTIKFIRTKTESMWFRFMRSVVRRLQIDGHAGFLVLDLYERVQSAQRCEHFNFVDIVVRNSIISYFFFHLLGNSLHSFGNLRCINTKIIHETRAFSQNSGIWGFTFKNCSLVARRATYVVDGRFFGHFFWKVEGTVRTHVNCRVAHVWLPYTVINV